MSYLHHSGCHSTMEVAIKCKKCGKWLKESEAYFLENECSECNYQDIIKKT